MSESQPSGSILNRILSKVPGFRGYVEYQDRLASEEKARRYAVEQLQAAKTAFDVISKKLVDEGRIDDVGTSDALRQTTDRLMNRLLSQLPAQGRFFATESIDEDLLEDIYDSDANLIDAAETFARQVQSAATDSLSAATFERLKASLDALQSQFERRSQLISNLQ